MSRPQPPTAPVLPERRLLEFPRTGAVAPFVNHYRFGPADVPAPCIVYIGGASTLERYERRRHTAPDAIVMPFAAAYEALQPGPVDLFVVPCPVDSEGDDEWIVSHLDQDLLPALLRPPTALVCVGYSAGDGHALVLAVIAGARGLAVMGPAGLGRTALALRKEIESLTVPLRARGYNNDRDPAGADTQWCKGLRSWLQFSWEQRPGGHRFNDYADNGSVRAAFRDVLQVLADK